MITGFFIYKYVSNRAQIPGSDCQYGKIWDGGHYIFDIESNLLFALHQSNVCNGMTATGLPMVRFDATKGICVW